MTMNGSLLKPELVMVSMGPLHLMAATNSTFGEMLPQGDWLRLDVNTGVHHLPQMYRETEVVPFDTVRLEDHGFCHECSGFGLTRLFAMFTVDTALDGQHGTVCTTCNGTGRPGVRIETVRFGGKTEIRMKWKERLKVLPCHDCASSFGG